MNEILGFVVLQELIVVLAWALRALIIELRRANKALEDDE